MRKKWMILIAIVTLMIGCHQKTVWADVGGSHSSSSSHSSHHSSHTSSKHSSSHRKSQMEDKWVVVSFLVGMSVTGWMDRFGLLDGNRAKSPYEQWKERKNTLKKMRDADPMFKKGAFVNEVKEIFIQVQEAWSARDMCLAKNVETPELFWLHQRQLERYLEKGWVPHVYTTRIKKVQLVSFSETDSEISLIVYLSAYVIDYTTNRDGDVVEGEEGKTYYREYRLRFTRLKGTNQHWRLEDYREWIDNEFLRY